MDGSGNLYGTTVNNGPCDLGSVFELMPSNGGWIHKVLHNFAGSTDGQRPRSTVVIDANGNLYGTASTAAGVYDFGLVWEITP